MFDIITFGSATQDILVKPRKLTVLKYDKKEAPRPEGPGSRSQSDIEICFPMGSKIDVEDIKFYSGGGGTNTAATFALQGLKTAFCGAVGDDISGKKITDELKQLKIDSKLVLKTKEKPTNHSIIIFGNDTDRTIFAYRGAAELMGKNNIPWNKIKSKWIYLAPLTGSLCGSFQDIVDFAKKNNIKVACNPSITQLSLNNFSEIAKKINILILNREEASFLTKMPLYGEKETGASFNKGARPSTQTDLSALVFKKINELCPDITVMTKGGEGVVVSDGKNIYRAKPHIERKIVDTTGAGDAFGAGFVAEFIKTGDIEKAIQMGMGNSAGCLSEIGAKNGLLKKGQEFNKVEVIKE